jgi:ankyrin repeat protein
MKLYQKKLVELLIKSGSDVNKQDRKGETALHGACRNRLSEIVALLIKAGAKVDIEGKKGTALNLAKKAGYQEVVEIPQNQSV